MSSNRIDRLAKRILPLWCRLPVRLARFHVGLLRQALNDHLRSSQYGGVALPGPLLRYRVQGGMVNGPTFLNYGLNCAQDLRSAVGRLGRTLGSFNHVLDFGCGCGRIIRWYYDLPDTCRLTGTDIDADACIWSKKNIPFARFELNDPMPPLRFKESTFDLILAASVLNHMDEDVQDAWLKELHRVACPDGYLLASFYGEIAQRFLEKDEQDRIARDGFYFKRGPGGIFKLDRLPEFYQTAYQTKEDAVSRCSNYFKVIDQLEGGLGNYEDLLILQK